MTDPEAARRRRLLLALGAVYLIWGGSFAATSVGVRNLPPFLFSGLRFTMAGVVLVSISLLLGNRPRLDWQEFKHIALVGIGAVVLSNGANSWSLQWLPSNQSALLNATGALWIGILSTFGPRAHALDRRTSLGLLLGFCGVVLVLGGARGSAAPAGQIPWLPEFVVLFGVFSWSCATVYLRSFQTRLDLLSFSGGQMIVGGGIMTMVGLSLGEAPRWHWSGPGILAFAYMVLMSSVVAYTAYAWLAKNTTPAIVGSYSYVNPTIATLLGWWLLNESLSGAQLLGMCIMLAGVALASWPTNRESAATANEGHGA